MLQRGIILYIVYMLNISTMNPNLLLSDMLRGPTTTNFCGMDSEEAYRKHLHSEPERMSAWKDRTVTYTMNEDYYRCPAWKDIAWGRSILVFGCSYAYGIGLDDQDTIGANLSRILGAPVVNLGQPSTSWTFNWINTVRLCASGITPRAVVYIWPDTSRLAHLSRDSKRASSLGIWNIGGSTLLPSGELGKAYALDIGHNTGMSREMLTCVRTLWSCPQVHYTWSTGMNILNLPDMKLLVPEDSARDLAHPGPRTAARWAATIARDLNYCGI